jgi:hypothetical protein
MANLSDKEQYERLGQDWRQVHNIIWGIPSAAISIITGMIVAAYQPYMEVWPRISTCYRIYFSVFHNGGGYKEESSDECDFCKVG